MFSTLRTIIAPTLLAAALLAACGNGAHAQTYPTATLTINGSEHFPNGLPDTGTLTVAINGTNGYTETIRYGQYDTQASIASGLAAQFSHDYIQFGLYAKAGANVTDPTVITFQFTGGQTFNSINYSGSFTSFGFNPTGFPSINPPPSPPPAITLSLNTGPATMGVAINGTNIGVNKANNSINFGGVIVPGTWTGSQIIFQIPSSFSISQGSNTVQVVLTVNGQASNTAQFTVIPAFTCPPN